jgi:3-hydroxybutyryl-CoA dehydratase
MCDNVKTFQEISIGDEVRFSKTITETDVYLYAGISGDFNPVHVDRVFAAGSFFKAPVVHGMLSAGLISALLGTKLPGPGSIYLSQTLKFLSPVRFNDTVTAKVKVVEKNIEKRHVVLETLCHNQNGDLVISGEARVFMPDPAQKPR